MDWDAKRQQLSVDGYCVIEGVMPKEMLAEVRAVSDALIDGQSAEELERHRSTGSMINTLAHPLMADVIALAPALEALRRLGFTDTRFSSGYIISKPPHSPRLFWHYDWAGWDAPHAFDPFPQQLFLMYYLVDTRRENGCLRVIPGSHLNDNSLHDLLDEAHTEALLRAQDPTAPAFSDRPDEVDVCVRAGDLVIGDSRLLHASHANTSDGRRTVITLWYHPDLHRFDERSQAFAARMTAPAPATWPEDKRRLFGGMLARYGGDAEPYPWNRRRPKRAAERQV